MKPSSLQSHRLARGTLTTLLTSLCLHAGLSFGADLASPRLAQPGVETVASEGIAHLQSSLHALERSMMQTRQQQHAHQQAELRSALTRLARSSAATSGRLVPRLHQGQPEEARRASNNALSLLASQLVTVQQRFPGATAIAAEAADINDLRQAMRRFDVVTDTIVSETFSTALLGLTGMMPTLSDDLMSYPRVAKHDLRERVVDTRLATAGAARLAASNSPQQQVDETALRGIAQGEALMAGAPTLSHGDEIASLDGAMGEIALGEMAAVSEPTWSDAGAADAQYAMEDDLLLDEIKLDELGSGAIASLASPVAADDLQDTRAGFMLPNGVRIDFAVTRMTSIDGLDSLQTIANLPAELDSQALSQIAGGRLANTQVLSPNGGSMFTLIQNDFDNQRIVDVTTIDIGIKNLGVRASDFVPRSLIPFNPRPLELNR